MPRLRSFCKTTCSRYAACHLPTNVRRCWPRQQACVQCLRARSSLEEVGGTLASPWVELGGAGMPCLQLGLEVFPTRSVFGKSMRWPRPERGAALASGAEPQTCLWVSGGEWWHGLQVIPWKGQMGLTAQQTFPLFFDFTSLKTWSIYRISLWALCAVPWLLAVVSDMRPPPTDGEPGQPGGRLKQMAWAGL